MTILYRTAASFVQAYLKIEKKAFLSVDELISHKTEKCGGLVVVGSYVQKTTEQLQQLVRVPNLLLAEINVERALSNDRAWLNGLVEKVNEGLAKGSTVVVYTSRSMVTDRSNEGNLSIGRRISEYVAVMVQGISVRPAFFIAKGGITSSDIATKGLNVRKAEIIGQVLPGVPVWRLGSESKYPRLAYIIFPGNVGAPDELARLVVRLQEAATENTTAA